MPRRVLRRELSVRRAVAGLATKLRRRRDYSREPAETFVRLFANAYRRQQVDREERETQAGGEMPARKPLTKHRASTSTRGRFAFGLCCRSNETRSPIANPPNGAQLEGTATILPSYIRVHAVVWACGEGQTDAQTETLVTTIGLHIASLSTHARCNEYRSKCDDALWLIPLVDKRVDGR